MLETGQKDEKDNSFALMMKTPKETSVLIAFQKPTAIWDIKMEDVPQLAVQDLKTTCSKKKRKKKNPSAQHTLQQSNTAYCMSFTT